MKKKIAKKVYSQFLQDVVIPGVFSEEERELSAGALSDDAAKKIAKGDRIDIRAPHMCVVSGKGGWVADPVQRENYSSSTNVSLIDHLSSVVRGSIMFAEIDMTGMNRDDAEIEKRLFTVAAIAFCHDADKALGLTRQDRLSSEQMAAFMERYGVDEFLRKHNVDLDPEQMLALVSEVESSQAGRLRPGMNLSPTFKAAKNDCIYVKLADQMEGQFLKKGQGIDAALASLDDVAKSGALKSNAITSDWKVVKLDDPNTPFLMDRMQYAISAACEDVNGFPPLLEIHHGGRLTCVIPRSTADDVVDRALSEISRALGGDMRVAVTDRGSIDILDARGGLADLKRALAKMHVNDREKLLRVRVGFQNEFANDIDQFLAPGNVLPNWPDMKKFPGRLVPMWSGCSSEDQYRDFHLTASLIVTLLSCQDGAAKAGFMQAEERESELTELLIDAGKIAEIPKWLAAEDAKDRRAVLAGLAAAIAENDDDFADLLVGHDGVLGRWLLGGGEKKGIVEKIVSTTDKLSSAIRSHFEALLSGITVRADDESALGRCHFTNMPISEKDSKINLKDDLYGLKVSAFSGREGRPESFKSREKQTLVAPIALAEHKLRKNTFVGNSKGRGVPVHVSSPTTSGLFGGLVLEGAPLDLHLVDFLRADLSKGGVTYSDKNGVSRRLLVGRFEEFPSTMVGDQNSLGQLGFVRGIMEMSLRLGRPVHVFRGLPRQIKDFVFFDTLPSVIEAALGGNGLRLEQIRPAITLLRGIELVADAPNFGLELAMAIADPDTRYASACDALSRAMRHENGGIKAFANNLLNKGAEMSEKDRSIVAFAEAMARYQKAPGRDDGVNVQERGFRLALEQAELLSARGLGSEEQMIAAIAGSIKAEYDRGQLTFRKGTDELQQAAEIFVRDVWAGAFGSMSPSAKLRRSAMAIYRWSFAQASAARIDEIRKSKAAA